MESAYTEDSPEFLDSLAKCTEDELRIRSGKSLEHLLSGRIENRAEAFFDREAFDKIHCGFLRDASKDDPVLASKSAELKPLITVKSYSEMHVALVDFLYRLMIEMDALYVSMFSIYNRCRSQSPLADVTSDVKRIRELKIERPAINIKDILSIYKVPDRVPECVSRFSVRGEVVGEAMRRIGADRYGPSSEFAEIIDKAVSADITEMPQMSESETESNTDNL